MSAPRNKSKGVRTVYFEAFINLTSKCTRT
jgi:hypothetical protein